MYKPLKRTYKEKCREYKIII